MLNFKCSEVNFNFIFSHRILILYICKSKIFHIEICVILREGKLELFQCLFLVGSKREENQVPKSKENTMIP